MNQHEEGQRCPQCKEGSLQFTIAGACSCHISPPCQACVDSFLLCDTCYWMPGEEEEEPPIITPGTAGAMV